MTTNTINRMAQAKDALQVARDAFESARDEAIEHKDYGVVSKLHNAANLMTTTQTRINNMLEGAAAEQQRAAKAAAKQAAK